MFKNLFLILIGGSIFLFLFGLGLTQLNRSILFDDTTAFVVCNRGCDQYVCDDVPQANRKDFVCTNPENFTDLETATAYFSGRSSDVSKELINADCFDVGSYTTYKNCTQLDELQLRYQDMLSSLGYYP